MIKIKNIHYIINTETCIFCINGIKIYYDGNDGYWIRYLYDNNGNFLRIEDETLNRRKNKNSI